MRCYYRFYIYTILFTRFVYTFTRQSCTFGHPRTRGVFRYVTYILQRVSPGRRDRELNKILRDLREYVNPVWRGKRRIRRFSLKGKKGKFSDWNYKTRPPDRIHVPSETCIEIFGCT